MLENKVIATAEKIESSGEEIKISDLIKAGKPYQVKTIIGLLNVQEWHLEFENGWNLPIWFANLISAIKFPIKIVAVIDKMEIE